MCSLNFGCLMGCKYGRLYSCLLKPSLLSSFDAEHSQMFFLSEPELGLLFHRCQESWHLECSNWGSLQGNSHSGALTGASPVIGLCSPLLSSPSLFKAWQPSGKVQGCRWIGWVWEERIFSPCLCLPVGPDFGRPPVGAGECCMVPELCLSL